MMPFQAAPALLALLVLAAPLTAAHGQQPGLTLLDTAVLRAPGLDESSGIVASRRRPGVFWTHNDSGNGPQLFATDSAGTDLGFVTVLYVPNIDWEDLSIGPCTLSEGTCLFVADIGDNDARRPDIRVYVVPEPEPPTGPGDTTRTVVPEQIVTLRYPDHPHDAEALAVIGRDLYLVTKDRIGPARLFTARLGPPGPTTLELRGTLALHTAALRGRLATGAAAAPNGLLLVVRTYMSIHVFALHQGVFAPLTGPDGLLIPVVETQGEGVCFDAAGRLVLSSERGSRNHAILTRLRLTGVPGL